MEVASAAPAEDQFGAQIYVKAVDNSSMTMAATNDGQTTNGLSVVPTDFCTCDGAQMQSLVSIISCTAATPSTCTEPKVSVEVQNERDLQ